MTTHLSRVRIDEQIPREPVLIKHDLHPIGISDLLRNQKNIQLIDHEDGLWLLCLRTNAKKLESRKHIRKDNRSAKGNA